MLKKVRPKRTKSALLQSSRATAHLRAPLLDFGFDGVANIAGENQPLFGRALEAGRVGKAPVQTSRTAGEARAAFGAGFIANGDHVRERLLRFEHVSDGFGLVARNIHADFAHNFHDDRIQFAGFDAGALRVEFFTSELVEKCLRHLAACAGVNADE